MIFINLILLNLLFLCDFVYAVELTELELLPDSDQQCETVQSEIHLFKEEFDELGRIKRTCNGEVLLNKCEGFCNSFVKPSSITVTGFLKECFCCRETFLQDRTIVLTHCYNSDGRRLTNSKLTEMEVRLKEPAECRCYKCGNFSR